MEGPFITTHTHKRLYFDHIDPDQICIEDIAHALSHICRFTGHTSNFYSVAQHCLLVDRVIPGLSRIHLGALLHDAAEAYVNDLSSPLKAWLDGTTTSSYTKLHDDILKAVYQKYNLFLAPDEEARIKKFDYGVTAWEAKYLLNLNPAQHGFDMSRVPEEFTSWDSKLMEFPNRWYLDLGGPEGFLDRFYCLYNGVRIF